jgi:hypothetical protein
MAQILSNLSKNFFDFFDSFAVKKFLWVKFSASSDLRSGGVWLIQTTKTL